MRIWTRGDAHRLDHAHAASAAVATPANTSSVDCLRPYRAALRSGSLAQRIGRVARLTGMAIEASGLHAAVGDMCSIATSTAEQSGSSGEEIAAEVVGINGDRVTLMMYGQADGIAIGAPIRSAGRQASIGVGAELLGRVIDGFGRALDGKPDPVPRAQRTLKGMSVNPMQRPRIDAVLHTGVRCIDGLLTLGRGQRVGIFAGSGVGKSTLLGMVAQHVEADINVIALIGERGREVREFIDKQLGSEGLRRSVVVVATSDQPALARIRAAHAAVAIAEEFRDSGKQVLLTMDSVTRLAMARREVGLAAGEPPTARGYTPSVFSELPQLCERCGTSPSGGAITALFTVLVEGDDMNEPIADCLRSVLDGHIVLTRQLAQRGHYPAIDVLKSASRLLPELTTPTERILITAVVERLALLERNQPLVEIGAYEAGANPALDRALSIQKDLTAWLMQSDGGSARAASMAGLNEILASAAHGAAHASKRGGPKAPAAAEGRL